MKRLSILLCISISIFSCSSRNYTGLMQKATKKALGGDFKHYDFFSYPTDNYGLATCYQTEASVPNFECDTWDCLGINPVPSEISSQLKLNDFAAVGTGPAITLTEKIKREIKIKTVLPEIFNILGVSFDADGTGIKTIDMSFGPGHVRNIQKQRFSDYLSKLPSTSRIGVFFTSGELVYVTSDVVLENFTVSISVDNSLESQLDAKIKQAPASGTFAGSSLNVQVSKSAQGKYTITSTKPLIVARWCKKVSGPGVLSDSNPGSDFSVKMHLTK